MFWYLADVMMFQYLFNTHSTFNFFVYLLKLSAKGRHVNVVADLRGALGTPPVHFHAVLGKGLPNSMLALPTLDMAEMLE